MATPVKVLVCGAGGMLGADVGRAAEEAGHAVVALSRHALDVTEAEPVMERVSRERPDAVVNCAAYTDVDGAEGELERATKANVDGARHVASAAAAAGAAVLYPSTDYVFDGSKGEPYLESDAPRPQSVYGQTKLAGERATQAANSRHYVVRSSWLFGANGRNFVDTMLRLGREQGEVVVVSDQVGSPTYTGHLAEGLVRLLGSDAYGTHHMAAAGECSWHQFAQEIFARADLACRVVACTTEQLARPAPRPKYSVLASEVPGAVRLPHWSEGLTSYLAERERDAAVRLARERA